VKPSRQTWPDLRALTALGFGPEATLMNEPRLLVDRRFLAALLWQLDEELGAEEARAALFQIGLLHGLRDAWRALRGEFLPAPRGAAFVPAAAPAGAMPLAIRLGLRLPDSPPGALSVAGAWPEAHEADARLSRAGPSSQPGCALSAGYTSGWLSGLWDAEVLAVEHRCQAQGDPACEFRAREAEHWRRGRERRGRELARAVDFAVLREAAARTPEAPAPELEALPFEEPREEEHGAFDPDAAVVHVWGPVMVIPFLDAHEVMQAVEMLTRDPGASGVRSVVVDLRGAPLGAEDGEALAHLFDALAGWGAEPVLVGVGSDAEEIVEQLEAGHAVLRSELPDAIALAFQVADAQRDCL